MARFPFRLPDIGEGVAEAEIVAWHVAVGDRVEEDQPLADMMTDKATVEIESPGAGTVVERAGEGGDQVPIGSALVVIETAPVHPEPVKRDEEDVGDVLPLADGLLDAASEAGAAAAHELFEADHPIDREAQPALGGGVVLGGARFAPRRVRAGPGGAE